MYLGYLIIACQSSPPWWYVHHLWDGQGATSQAQKAINNIVPVRVVYLHKRKCPPSSLTKATAYLQQ